jgi:hypothetical protein
MASWLQRTNGRKGRQNDHRLGIFRILKEYVRHQIRIETGFKNEFERSKLLEDVVRRPQRWRKATTSMLQHMGWKKVRPFNCLMDRPNAFSSLKA